MLALISLLSGCVPTACASFCAERADCLEAEIEAYDSTWSEWTGHGDRAAFEASCVAAFDGNNAAGRAEELCEEEDAC